MSNFYEQRDLASVLWSEDSRIEASKPDDEVYRIYIVIHLIARYKDLEGILAAIRNKTKTGMGGFTFQWQNKFDKRRSSAKRFVPILYSVC